ncbi:hypothetical protein SAMN06297251_10296 [Fulvimarina manganoxydans]|uniref:Uncharacterized protein n=1 Tax=Fulvimarina manganoxydans TaxID=937218 RepID=A0A1W1YZ02_9HYPH|nr:hypothetical protein [Fulvimarina manganoxydans]SMC41312.1 hypothetical protein SAMN06297251_10296 [Fulvimarina manganoxydans]
MPNARPTISDLIMALDYADGLIDELHRDNEAFAAAVDASDIPGVDHLTDLLSGLRRMEGGAPASDQIAA